MALDTRVKNVVSTYALEHKSIDDDFDSVFGCLDLLRQESEEIPSLFQKLIFCVGTIQRVICQHMLKEEEQVPFNFFHCLSYRDCISS
jgi:zinc finger protein-like protein